MTGGSPACEMCARRQPEADAPAAVAAFVVVLDDDSLRAVEVDPVDNDVEALLPGPRMAVKELLLCEDCLPPLMANASREGISHQVEWLATGERSLVTRTTPYYAGAGPSTYDDIPYEDLLVEAIDWYHREAHVEERATRKGTNEFSPTCEQATEAALDPHRLIGPASDLSIRVIGMSSSAPGRDGGTGRILKVMLMPKDHPPDGEWWGATAMEANRGERRRYLEERGEHGG